ncbi:MAG: adenosylcobinamide-GDP ribazoletransferase, partial [Serpentinimonas sp.]|nr:adenosylcobinamide-GDP ribazoletransferase [Serpentinimonas sp.]
RGLIWALALAALLAAPGLWWVSGADLLAGLLGALLGAAWMGRWLLRRLGGYTGDGLGALQQAAALGLLLGVALQWPGAAG